MRIGCGSFKNEVTESLRLGWRVCVCVSLDSIQYHSGSHPVAISQDTVGRRFVVRIALQNAPHAMCDMFHIR